MKPILIATDFSPAALHAADYAAQLAIVTHSPLVLFHARGLPSLNGEVVVGSYSLAEYEKGAQHTLDAEANRIMKKWNVQPVVLQSAGIAVTEIENCCLACNARLVVMGMRQTDVIERAFGSVVTAFIKRNLFPLLVIPEKAKFKKPEKILFATDLHTNEKWKELELLEELATKFGAEIHILNVVRQELQPVVTLGNDDAHQLEKLLHHYQHTWHYEEAGDVATGIYKTADETFSQWITVVHHDMNWFQRLFNKSTARQLAFATNIPLLVLPEKPTSSKK